MAVNLTKRQKAIIIGTVLGDGYLQKTGAKNARLRLEHSIKQKDYLLWKVVQINKRLFRGKPSHLTRTHPHSRKVYRYVRYQSNSTPILGKLREKFYQDGQKIIPEELSRLLTQTLGLAVWYMDDGFYYPRDKCAYLYLGKVSQSEAMIAKNTLEENFGLQCRILNKREKGYALYFSPQQTRKLKSIIVEHVLPEMKYKLPT